MTPGAKICQGTIFQQANQRLNTTTLTNGFLIALGWERWPFLKGALEDKQIIHGYM